MVTQKTPVYFRPARAFSLHYDTGACWPASTDDADPVSVAMHPWRLLSYRSRHPERAIVVQTRHRVEKCASVWCTSITATNHTAAVNRCKESLSTIARDEWPMSWLTLKRQLQVRCNTITATFRAVRVPYREWLEMRDIEMPHNENCMGWKMQNCKRTRSDSLRTCGRFSWRNNKRNRLLTTNSR